MLCIRRSQGVLQHGNRPFGRIVQADQVAYLCQFQGGRGGGVGWCQAHPWRTWIGHASGWHLSSIWRKLPIHDLQGCCLTDWDTPVFCPLVHIPLNLSHPRTYLNVFIWQFILQIHHPVNKWWWMHSTNNCFSYCLTLVIMGKWGMCSKWAQHSALLVMIIQWESDPCQWIPISKWLSY